MKEMKQKGNIVSDTSPLANAGFERIPEWDFSINKKKKAERYIKEIDGKLIMAYKTSWGYTFGVLAEPDKPLCSKYGSAASVKEIIDKVKKWV